MPVFLVVVLVLALIAVVAMVIGRSRALKSRTRRQGEPLGEDSPRMPMGDLPPRASHRRQ